MLVVVVGGGQFGRQFLGNFKIGKSGLDIAGLPVLPLPGSEEFLSSAGDSFFLVSRAQRVLSPARELSTRTRVKSLRRRRLRPVEESLVGRMVLGRDF